MVYSLTRRNCICTRWECKSINRAALSSIRCSRAVCHISTQLEIALVGVLWQVSLSSRAKWPPKYQPVNVCNSHHLSRLWLSTLHPNWQPSVPQQRKRLASVTRLPRDVSLLPPMAAPSHSAPIAALHSSLLMLIAVYCSAQRSLGHALAT